MPVYTAPGIYSLVQDVSQYAAPTSPTIAGMVGAARRGPVLGHYDPVTKRYGQPTLITSPAEFIATFGTPDPNAQGPYGALLYLQVGNQLRYGRVVGSGAATATHVFDSRVEVDAASVGAWGNALAITIEDSAIASAKKLSVYELVGTDLILREAYDGLVNDSTSDNFYETIINGVSQYIAVTCSLTGQPSNHTAVYLTGGLDGAPPADADIIGAQFSGYATGLWAFSDRDTIDVTMLAAPGYASRNVVSAIATICAARQDCMGLMHGPLGLNVDEIIDWHNATGAFDPSGGTPSVKVTTPTCALYWPWVEIFDNYNSRNIWVPPVGFAAQKFAYTDQNAETWYAPAGIRRGQLFEALRVEYTATLGDREAMYGPGNGNAVNPIVNLPLDGICIYGQRTLQRTSSSLDRINVQRLIFFLNKVLTRSARSLVFEQNDSILWDQFKQIVGPFVSDVKSRRGVEDFAIVCDKSTNTPQRRNNNEMYGYVLIVPTKSAEKIIINFSLFPSGAKLSIPQIG